MDGKQFLELSEEEQKAVRKTFNTEAWVVVDPNEYRPYVPLERQEFVPIPNNDPELEELCI